MLPLRFPGASSSRRPRSDLRIRAAAAPVLWARLPSQAQISDYGCPTNETDTVAAFAVSPPITGLNTTLPLPPHGNSSSVEMGAGSL
jgi:hypothetical protein